MKKKEKDALGYDKYEHESYGAITISRGSKTGSGNFMNLFGSSIKHGHTITLNISRADLSRGKGHEHIFAKETLIEVEMSAAQFADAITTLNHGCTPVTLKRVNGKQVEDCPHMSKLQQFNEEFHDTMEGVGEAFTEVVTMAEEMVHGKAGKTEKRELLKKLKMAIGRITNGIPFLTDQFTEQMEKTTTEAKAEVESFITNKLHALGLEKYKEEMPVLEDHSDERH